MVHQSDLQIHTEQTEAGQLFKTTCLLCFVLVATMFFDCGQKTFAVMADELVVREVEADIRNISSGQEAIGKSITLYEAMARAIKYNREHKLKQMQSALALQKSKKSYYEFLPELTVNAGYTGRSNDSASSSESYFTGQESLEASISEDRNLGTTDISLSWSSLDFSLAYVRSSQESDRYFVAKQAQRKAVQNIISEVRWEWWKALSAQRLLQKIEPFVGRVEEALTESREIENQRLDSPLKPLLYQRSLLDMWRTLEKLRAQLNSSKHRLTSMMGMGYKEKFVLNDPGEMSAIDNITWDIEQMETRALILRPELMQSRYQDRISAEETRAALMGLLPSLNLNAGWNYDSNSYLVHDSWFDYGAQISWNLLNIFKSPVTLRTAEAEERVSRQRRLAVAMTVLMQVHLAKADYLEKERQFAIEEKALYVENRVLEQIVAATQAEAYGNQTLIREELNQLLAEVRYSNAYADLQNSFGRILVSIGVDNIPKNIESMTIQDLADHLAQNVSINHLAALEEDSNPIPVMITETVEPEVTISPEDSTPEPVITAKPVTIIAEEDSTPVQVMTVEAADPETIIAQEDPESAASFNDAVNLADEVSLETREQAIEEVKPVPQNPPDEFVMFIEDGVNIYSDSNIEASTLARVSAQGQKFSLLEKKEGWVKLKFYDTIGWVNEKSTSAVQL